MAMSAKLLQEFFRAKKVESDKGEHVDWAARKNSWISDVENLYGQIRTWLDASMERGDIRISTHPKAITEDYIGEYEIDELRLTVGDETVLFSPKGALVVRASGRVDITGNRGVETLILQREHKWSIVASKTPTLKLVPLTEDSLLEALKTVME